MKLNQMNIDKQLKIILSFLVIVVGLMSAFTIWQAVELSQQTETLYNHPLQVRRALDNIKIDQQKMSVVIRDLEMAETGEEQIHAYDHLILYKTQIPAYIKVLEDLYLGPEEDVEKISTSYSLWEDMLLRNANRILEGEAAMTRIDMKSGGEYDTHTKELQGAFNTVDAFAKQKADELYQFSEERRTSIMVSNFVLILLFLIIMYGISKRIYNSIQDPLRELVGVVKQVEEGKLSERSSILSKNEFGELAAGLNGMLDSIENVSKLNKKSASLSDIMLVDEDTDTFFESLLSELLVSLNGQLGGVYLMAEDKKSYDLFVSIGMEKGKRASFDRESLEGELGLVMGSRKIQVLKQVSENTRFVYAMAVGDLVPKEIITLPIMNQDEMIAFITMASLVGFDELSEVLLENERTVMSTRIQSVLDNQQTKMIKEKLEIQNIELEAQKSELDALSLELREQNQELEQQKTELSEANRLKTNFLSNMSHELRTPLNSVIALSGVLERRLKERVTEEESNYLEVIGRSGKNLLEMINEILDISRIESGREEMDVKLFDINELIREVLAMLAPIAEEKDISLTNRMIGNEKWMRSDRKKIQHIIQNLLSNAVKFTEQGSVEISAEIDRGYLNLQVSDTGIGISSQHQESIFEEFRQADNSTTRRYGGTGLGLAIAKKYAEFLGGKITVQSIVGEGSKFTLSLPNMVDLGERFDTPQEEKHVENYESPFDFLQARKEQTLKTQEHLLIVEDSEPAIIQLWDIFEEGGYRLSTARDGEEAIRMIQKEQPDGIILDLMMPKVDGFEVLKTIRESRATSKIPVLVLSAKHITKRELSLLKHNRIYQLIQKGNVNLDELRQAVTSMLHPVVPQKEMAHQKLGDQTEKPVVLVVEDNPDNRLTARAVLGDYFYVLEAEDGEQAVAMAAEHVPDLILMDSALPGMDGVEAFRMIRSNERLAHIPIVALTASAMTTDREIFLAYGFDGFIAKPIIEEELLNTIKGVLYGE